MIVYIDESGDLGWVFTKPFRHGGSSRYLTISCLAVPNQLRYHPKRVIKDVYKKFSISPKVEIKGAELNNAQITYFTQRVINLLQTHKEIGIYSITVKKKNVQQHIRDDGNKLYNYMLSLLLIDKIKSESIVTLIPDPRNIKVASGNSLIDYLQINLWFVQGSKTKLLQERIPSDKCDNLKFIDIVTHILWKKYEDGDRINADKLSPFIKEKHLYF